MSVKFIWSTPDAEKLMGYIARVSNITNQDNPDVTKLLKYMIKHKHWSPFEMANMCLEITTSRDVSAQIIRHRSFSFQEFSQRYAAAYNIENTNPRKQDTKNRQNSTEDLDENIQLWWAVRQKDLNIKVREFYEEAIKLGIAKESARRILPMATTTKLYMNGTLRSWMHYFDLRCDSSTQKEHRDIALAAKDIFLSKFPILAEILTDANI